MASNAPYSLANMVKVISDNFAIVFIVGLFALGGFFTGSVWTENQLLKAGGLAGRGTGTGAAAGDTVAAPDPGGPTAETLKNIKPLSDEDHVRGSKNATVTLVEYSDFECPFCARFHTTLQQVRETYGDKVAIAYRHYPLSFHPSAQKAAEASECVAKQKGNDGFWQYNDRIFEDNLKNNSITLETVNQAAQAAGVNMDQFKTCLDSGEMAKKVADQMAEGSGIGVSGTPGTVVITDDGQYEFINGALPFEQVKTIVDKYI